ncbi:Lrp/AsnC family transcriptional regulator [Sphingomonas swuensis]|uniref:Lrp/AsnC family transcriptional regulator n=1 Tax=Sphingomonas swuensis TaxID=977800 RepID=A0ABP7SKZ3_9SPHN
MNLPDLKILRALQQDASRSIADLAEVVSLSSNAVWKRLRRLEAEGYVERRVAVLDRRKLGLPVTVFVSVRTDQHSQRWAEEFAAAVGEVEEVVEFYRMAGDVDYLLKIVCADIDDYDRIYRKIIAAVPLRDVSASFAMEQLKYTTELPLSRIGERRS